MRLTDWEFKCQMRDVCLPVYFPLVIIAEAGVRYSYRTVGQTICARRYVQFGY